VTARQLAVAVAALVVGLLGRLVLRVSPRVGVRLVRWAAGLRYRGDPERAALRAEELAGLVDDRPGRLLKLLTGLGFALHALTVAALRARPGRMQPPVARFIKGVVRRLPQAFVDNLVPFLILAVLSIVYPLGLWFLWVLVPAWGATWVVRVVLRVAPEFGLGFWIGTVIAVVTARMVGVGAGAPAGGAAAVVTVVVVGVRAWHRRRTTSDLEAR
jgi:hypothetical protein